MGAGILALHFDVEEHFIYADTFLQTAQSVRRLIDQINQAIFDGKLDYEVVILPPEEGSFLSYFQVLSVTGVALFGFVNTPVGAAFIEGLTGETPETWSKKLGVFVADAVQGKRDVSEADSSIMGSEKVESETGEYCPLDASFLSVIARGFLEKDTEQVAALGMPGLDEVINERASFYEACLKDNRIKGVGFDESNHFPIPRASFPERAIRRQSPKDEPSDELPWIIEINSVVVTSPNWDVGDQKTRQWKGKISKNKDCLFVVEDEGFWLLVDKRALPLSVSDEIKVQWAYQIVNGKPKNRRVLRVLRYNGQNISDPLTSEELRLWNKSVVEAIGDVPQLSLFTPTGAAV